jgi:hypothetical protein
VAVAELAAALPQGGRSGAIYADAAFGRCARGWSPAGADWLAHCIGLAWVATTLGIIRLERVAPAAYGYRHPAAVQRHPAAGCAGGRHQPS